MSLEAFIAKIGQADDPSFWRTMCVNCGGSEETHVQTQCLFQPTHFLAFTPEQAAVKAQETKERLKTTAGSIRETVRSMLVAESFARQILPTQPVKQEKAQRTLSKAERRARKAGR